MTFAYDCSNSSVHQYIEAPKMKTSFSEIQFVSYTFRNYLKCRDSDVAFDEVNSMAPFHSASATIILSYLFLLLIFDSVKFSYWSIRIKNNENIPPQITETL